ncbi:MAG: thermonuclease family protein [Bacillota bacterium]|nr:thermonuclease family protein [Bacillota bacterium]
MKFVFVPFVIFLSIFISGCSSIGNSNNIPSQTIAKYSQQNTENSKQQTSGEKVNSTSNNNLISATIVKNIDGDTVEINLNGKVEKIRMLCIDTPETHHPRLGVQPFGPEAAAYTAKILTVGKKVQIEPGIGNGRDKYGRLLAYIFVDDKMFNEMLLEKGLARVAYIYAPNTKYVDEFYSIQKKAQQEGIGIWSIENYAQKDGFHSNASKSTEKNSPAPKTNDQKNVNVDQEVNIMCKGKIKGNANSHIYHVPGDSFYDSTKVNIVWFCTEQDAIKAGYRKSKR